LRRRRWKERKRRRNRLARHATSDQTLATGNPFSHTATHASLQLSEPPNCPPPLATHERKLQRNAARLNLETSTWDTEARRRNSVRPEKSWSKWKEKQKAMAFLLPKLSTPSCKSLPSPLPKSQLALPVHAGGKLHCSGPAQTTAPGHVSLLLLLSASQQEAATAVAPSKSTETKNWSKGGGDPQRSDFYLNLGTAVRTLRDDLPAVFVREPNYDIYR
jgi:hypothetical protein